MTIQIYPIKVSKQLFKNYCYLIVHSETRQAVLIDPAWEMEKIENVINTLQVKLNAILLTHYHFDHVNLAEPIARQFNVPVLMSKIEIGYYNFSCYGLLSVDNPQPLIFGEIKIIPLLTPGHTKGAFSYWIEEALFTGDTLFIEGCGMCSGRGGDPSAMFDTLVSLKRIIPHHIRIYPGHSYGEEPGKTFFYLLQNNIYLQFSNRAAFIAFRMRENQQGLLAFR